MLREILSISGKPGLFKIVKQGNRMLIVEDLKTKKRFPVMQRDKVISLGDIAMYTQAEDKPLGEILDLVYENAGGKEIDIKELAATGKLRDKFAEILPDFDNDRVHDTDIKKLFTWYNLLLESGMTKFTEEEKKGEPEDNKEEAAPEEKKETASEEKK